MEQTFAYKRLHYSPLVIHELCTVTSKTFVSYVKKVTNVRRENAIAGLRIDYGGKQVLDSTKPLYSQPSNNKQDSENTQL